MNFARLIDLREAYELYDSHPDFHAAQLAKLVEEEMIKLERFTDDYLSMEFEDIRLQFSYMARNYKTTEEQFETLLERLYNWGDQRLDDGTRVCWVENHMKPTEMLKRFAPTTHSTQIPYKYAEALEKVGLVKWVGNYLGTHQYALTDEGRKQREKDNWKQ